ncbi:Serpentine receptor class r-10 [Caenorhabditis elegans]|uniref:Serpentine receptor class r-10 n=1 Tax=Caenorhabditis elegans TaxID=6239 RepID=O62280_CAEEL|nr:Seven TM Receptor [Caenorhabditis elegans]CAB04536.1 Seven TM Receptor [Caenorhabditis elegans]|eukprot:NP_507472.1 Seven TM Receptor [Caenorhabditis elegans]
MAISVQQVSTYAGFCLSILINSILMYMIRKKTTKQLGSYVYLMLSFSIFELVFSTVDVLNQPMIFVNEGEFLFFSTNPLHLHKTVAKHFNLINFACSGIIISLLAIHFFYRYLAVCNNQAWLQHFEMPKFFIWISIFVLFGLEWYLATLFLGEAKDTVCEVDIDALVEYYKVDPLTTVFVGIKYHVTTAPGTIFCGKSILLAVILLKIVVISCSIVTYCGIRIWREISIKKRVVSRRTLDMQRQFFRALVVQTLIPIFLLYLPLATMLLAPILMANLHKIDVIIQFCFVFYPILDPIAVLIIVRDYRRAIRNFLDEQIWKRFLGVLLPWLLPNRPIEVPPMIHVPQPVMPRFIY